MDCYIIVGTLKLMYHDHTDEIKTVSGFGASLCKLRHMLSLYLSGASSIFRHPV